jgi:succinate dehydrogenase (ubiquinone) cytochrome b560 subunit
MPFDGAQLVDLVHSLPEWAKSGSKVLLATPFAFHSWNGVRHLLWDSGKCTHFLHLLSMSFVGSKFPITVLSVKGAYATGYMVLGATAVTTVGLLFI